MIAKTYDDKNTPSPEALNTYLSKELKADYSYTVAYYYWKKMQTVHRLFQDELGTKTGPIKVIDVGCAFGINIFSINHDFGRAHDLEFFGVDLNPMEIHFCNLKKEKHEIGNCTFAAMNTESLNYPDNSFDILFSIEVLEHLQHPEKAVNEFYRVLKPNGLAIITTPNGSNLVSRPRKILRSILQISEESQTYVHKENSNSIFDKSNNVNENVGYGHISVKSLKEWMGILSKSGFKIERNERGSLLRGSSSLDNNRAILALALMVEICLDRLPWLKNLSEDVILSTRKPA